MDLELKELGVTFMVGAFTILSLEAILHHLFSLQLTGFFQGILWRGRKKSNEDRDAVKGHDKEESRVYLTKATVFVAIAFAIGILAEDLSYKYVDSVQTPFKSLPAAISSILPPELNKRLGLPSKEGSRINTLINGLGETPEPQPLAIDLANSGAFSLLDPVGGRKIENWIANPVKPEQESGKDCPSISEIKASIYRVYYYAKNRVYLNQTYFDEMRKIETRRDFSRSISLIAFVYLIVALVLGLGRTVHLLVKHKSRADKMGRSRVLPVCLVLFCIYFFSMWAYERESDEFNKRAFGYFSTMLITEKRGVK